MMNNFEHRKNMPSNEDFLLKLLELVTGDKSDIHNYTVDLDDLTKQIKILLQDEFNGEARVERNHTISLRFTNSERFIIKIEKCGFCSG